MYKHRYKYFLFPAAKAVKKNRAAAGCSSMPIRVTSGQNGQKSG